MSYLTTFRTIFCLAFCLSLVTGITGAQVVSPRPVWHDNDDSVDVYTQEFILALASTGHVNLVGTSTTSSVTPFNPYITPQTAARFGDERVDIQAAAVASGITGAPPVTTDVLVGHIEKPASGLVEDAVALNTVVGNAIAAAANQYGSPENPLVVICGGPMTAVADAYLIDPTIADKVLVTWVGGSPGGFDEYNSVIDGWGNAVAVKYLQVIQFTADQPSLFAFAPLVPKSWIARCLPPSPLKDLMFDKDHPTNFLPANIDADGTAVAVVVDPTIIRSSVRKSFAGMTTFTLEGVPREVPVLVDDPNGNVQTVTAFDQPLATRVFWRAFERALGGLTADPFRYYPLDDTLAEAEVALGTHELFVSYNGPLVTLRRDSDGAVATFHEGSFQGSLNTVRGGGGTHISEWINPNDVIRVITWYDQSGNGHDGIAASPASAPRIVSDGRVIRGSRNEPVIRFSAQDTLEVDEGQVLSDTVNLSVSIWSQVEPSSVVSRGILSKASLTPTTGGWGISVTTPDQHQVAIGDIGSSGLATSGQGSIPQSEWHHTSTVFDGGLSGNSNKLKSWLDSAPLSLTFGNGNLPNRIEAAQSSLSIGKNGTDLFLDGELGELIVWTTGLNSAQATELHQRRYVTEFSSPGASVPFHKWASLAGIPEDPLAITQGDGVASLLKYAFNLDPNASDVRILAPGETATAGLPRTTFTHNPDGTLEVELVYLRRKNSGLIYIPELARTLGDWQLFDQEPRIVEVNSEWERAIITSIDVTRDEPGRFFRVKVRTP